MILEANIEDDVYTLPVAWCERGRGVESVTCYLSIHPQPDRYE